MINIIAGKLRGDPVVQPYVVLRARRPFAVLRREAHFYG